MKTTRWHLVALGTALALSAAASGSLLAQVQQINLQAVAKTRTINAQAIPFWTFSPMSGPLRRAVPGQRVNVWAGTNTLKIKLVNNLPVPTSIAIPGLPLPTVEWGPGGVNKASGVVRTPDGRIRSLVPETPPTEDRTYIWKNIKFSPGTYLYQSGTHPSIQVPMGLYGEVRKISPGNKIYPGIPRNPKTEGTLLYHEVDPVLNAAVAGGTYGTAVFPTSIDYHPTVFLINGATFNFTEADGKTLPFMRVKSSAAPVAIRMLNAGLTTRLPTFLGTTVRKVAEDGKKLSSPQELSTVDLPAGKTVDAIIEQPIANGKYPVFDRRLERSKAGRNGGMVTALSIEVP